MKVPLIIGLAVSVTVGIILMSTTILDISNSTELAQNASAENNTATSNLIKILPPILIGVVLIAILSWISMSIKTEKREQRSLEETKDHLLPLTKFGDISINCEDEDNDSVLITGNKYVSTEDENNEEELSTIIRIPEINKEDEDKHFW